MGQLADVKMHPSVRRFRAKRYSHLSERQTAQGHYLSVRESFIHLFVFHSHFVNTVPIKKYPNNIITYKLKSAEIQLCKKMYIKIHFFW